MKKEFIKKFGRINIVASILALSFSLIHAQIITTVAGNGTGSYGGDGGPATAAGLNLPTGVFVDSKGNIYIADQLNNVVRMVNPAGIISTIAGTGNGGYSGDGGPATSAELSWPIGVYVDGQGNIYVAENTGYRVRKIDTSGIITTVAGTGNVGYSGDGGPAILAELNRPAGLYVDSIGRLYISDWENSVIRRVDTAGIINTIIGTATPGYSGDGGPADSAKLDWTFEIYMDHSENLFITDRLNNVIRKVNASDTITTIAGTGAQGYYGDGLPATSARLNRPCGVWGDSIGDIFIGDYQNNVIRKVDTSGIITTIAGTGTAGYSGDGGLATLAELNMPISIYVDGYGNIFIADQVNNRVRKITNANAPPPVAAFESSDTTFCANDCINFTDLSSYATSWQWTFTGGLPPSSAAENPQGVCYTQGGVYTVTLVASNSTGSDTVTLTDFIHVIAAPPTAVITQSHDTLFCSTDTSYTSYQWYTDTALIPGATDTFYVASASGNYNVRVSNANGCSVAVGINVIITGVSSLSSAQEDGLEIYPNPAGNQFTIHNSQFTIKEIKIYNILGQVCDQYEITNPKSEIMIDVDGFASGVYLLQLITENKVYQTKLIKE